METYISNIELINDYINNLLSQSERQDFESKLKRDAEFNSLYEDQIIFVNGLSRIPVKADILKAKRIYLTEKWLKITGVSIVVLGVLVMLYTVVFNTSEIDPTPNNAQQQTIILDSKSDEPPSSEIEIDSSKVTTDSIVSNSETETTYFTTTSLVQKYGSTSETLIDWSKQAHIIKLNTQRDTVITCKEGTVLKIPNGAFINAKTKKPITGPINLNVTEYYQLSDILMANLSTVSNGKQLETGGMLYIEAKQGNSQLELKHGKSIDISFPTKHKKPGMQLFSGEWKDEIINWNLENNDELENLDISEEELEEHIDVPFSVVEQIPTFPGCKNEDYEISKQCTKDAISKFINRNFNTDVGLGLGLSGRQRINCIFKINQQGNVAFVRTRGSHSRLNEEAERVINMLPQMSPGRQRGKTVNVPYSLPLIFELDDDYIKQKFGSESKTIVTRIEGTRDSIGVTREVIEGVEMDTVYTRSRGIAEKIREVMHDKDFAVDSTFISEWKQYKKQTLIRQRNLRNVEYYILRKSLFEMQNTRFKILEDDSITRGGHVIRIPWDERNIPSSITMKLVPKIKFSAGTDLVTEKEFEARLDDETDTSISTNDVTYYALRSMNLGWINCDRFTYRNSKRIKYKLKIKNAEGANVSMVFKSINSVLPSRYAHGFYDFQTVGSGEAVVLVAIKRKDGKLYYDMIETTTEINPKLDFDFKEVNIDILKGELEQLHSTFD